MKKLVAVLLLTLLGQAQLRGESLPASFDLGSGDRELVVGLTDNTSQGFLVGTYPGGLLDDGGLAVDDDTMNRLQVSYSSIRGLYGMRPLTLMLFPCHPFGAGKAFIRRPYGAARKVAGKMVRSTDFIVLERNGARITARILDESSVKADYNLGEKDILLGVMDGFVFSSRSDVSDYVYAHNLVKRFVYMWRFDGILGVGGVVRGLRQDYGFLVARKVFHSHSSAPFERTFIESSFMEAVNGTMD